MLLAPLCLAVLAPPAPRAAGPSLADPAAVALSRKFVRNEKLAYNVNSHITAEVRGKGLDTFIPEDLDIDYGFTYFVEALKADGVALIRFQQPSMTETEGETATSGPKAKVEKSDKVYEMSVSPINELLDTKDITPPKPTKKKPHSSAFARWASPGTYRQAPIFGDYVGEMHRLALFVGNLTFAPSLPLEPVKVGDTWKRTASYQPQKLKGSKKSAVQRLDYTYTYMGPMQVDGKSILRIQAKLDLNSDLGDYLRTLMADYGMDEKETNIKTMPLHMKATIDFDLDPATRHTLAAAAMSEGGFEINIKDESDPVYEERFKGRTALALVGRKIVAAGK